MSSKTMLRLTKEAAEKRAEEAARDRRVLKKLGEAIRDQRARVGGRAHTGGKRAAFELGFIDENAGVVLIDSRFAMSGRFDCFEKGRVHVDIDGTIVQCSAVVTEETDGTVAVRIDANDDAYSWFWLTIST